MSEDAFFPPELPMWQTYLFQTYKPENFLNAWIERGFEGNIISGPPQEMCEYHVTPESLEKNIDIIKKPVTTQAGNSDFIVQQHVTSNRWGTQGYILVDQETGENKKSLDLNGCGPQNNTIIVDQEKDPAHNTVALIVEKNCFEVFMVKDDISVRMKWHEIPQVGLGYVALSPNFNVAHLTNEQLFKNPEEARDIIFENIMTALDVIDGFVQEELIVPMTESPSQIVYRKMQP